MPGNGPADDFKSSWQSALGYEVSVKMNSRWRGKWLREILSQTQAEDSVVCCLNSGSSRDADPEVQRKASPSAVVSTAVKSPRREAEVEIHVERCCGGW